MLSREDELRLSDEVQHRYAQCGEDAGAKETVTVAVQQQVLLEFGCTKEEEEDGLELLRTALALFPGDSEVKNSAHWLKYNIHVSCPLTVGSTVPDVSLFTTSAQTVSLHSILAQSNRPTILVAGSHT
mmetsp:Transcript_35400/g.69436  ORF Transcript_35400/g.69436 Transcript_35400/m.69436 type:complete len:128 (+) Transcript_35400:256-639(+)